MYYQVLIETELKKLYDLDIQDKDALIRDIVEPYVENRDFIVDGYTISRNKIIRLKIMTTKKSVYLLSDYENANMSQGIIMYVSPQDILSYNEYTTDITRDLLKEVGEMKSKNSSINDVVEIDKERVFIVHGHDDLAKTEVARFIEKLGLKPIILHEQASGGKTIIEKIEEYSNVGFGIVIYTPCDVGNSKDKRDNLNQRARQNVIFEHGYLIGKIGRFNVCALVKEDIEKPNDISGVVYTQMDKHNAWQFQIAKEMKNIGYEIDLNCLI
ncbi:DNA-binding protein [Paeniclostridium sordellii]|uniref:TIR domain-containing protein n=1 Tax=Paraclostridium sordellii TaxID=1505 RepID=UPI0012EE317D|nr:nucleotide-binding protein [Paeniclostridium sordellii]MVO75746.1 DNA-binding protein [Paeniclostridium sordellii]